MVLQAQRRTGGTGLGLYSLAKRLESLGGLCGVEELANGRRGSCFWFAFPYRPHENLVEIEATSGRDSMRVRNVLTDDMRNMNRSLSVDEGAVGMSSMMCSFLRQECTASCGERQDRAPILIKRSSLSILLVDDSGLIRKATSRSLARQGHKVEVAQHGAECLQILESKLKKFDLILMDLQMPVMDGLEATRRIREVEKEGSMSDGPAEACRPHIAIVGFTANTVAESRSACLESGMDGFLEKPLSMKSFQECLEAEGLHCILK